MKDRTSYPLVFLPLLALLGACSFTVSGDSQCEVTGQRSVDLDASGVETLALTAGAGGLVVEGRSDLDRIRVRGEACASDAELLEAIGLEGRSDGARAVVRAAMPDAGDGRRAQMDLTVELPASVAVEIEDGSGPTTVRGVAGVTVDDGSGSLEIREVRGDVVVTDGSGSLEVLDVSGSVRVDDGSGSLTIRRVEGSVTVRDGSGGIHVSEVTGDLIVEEDGSGDLETEGVLGEVIVE